MMNSEKDNINNNSGSLEGIAIVGMGGRFPMSQNVEEFWQNLAAGRECLSVFSEAELAKAGVDPDLLYHPNYVKSRGVLEDIELFDGSFFGLSPRECEIKDPHHRLLLECAWQTLESAGYDSERYPGRIGIFAGQSLNSYLILNVYPSLEKVIGVATLQAAIGNDKDSLTTNISYRLNLRGPGVTIQSSSSTSLVAVGIACQNLVTYQCDMALAGGITADSQQKCGYLYEEGSILSPDGHCKPFDGRAGGFVPGSGMGLVLLKRLEDAIADGDYIYAVIKGWAINNDGSEKVSYTAPSVDAQAEVIVEAQALAGFPPDTITYVEAHGTGTNMGDPIEVAALTQAFRTGTDKKKFCALGSVKSNIGHLDTAAGVTGLIKTALAIKNRTIPASLNFQVPNPKIDFENSPFFVNTRTRKWITDGFPIRAGVTSLGMGGTNAHVVLEEAPLQQSTVSSREWKLLLLSAKTAGALNRMAGNLAAYLKTNPAAGLTDIAYTLQVGRREFKHRRVVICNSGTEAALLLESPAAGAGLQAVLEPGAGSTVFMFTGQGSQYVDMCRELYNKEALFRKTIDRCAELLLPVLGEDIRAVIYPPDAELEAARRKINCTYLAQPAIFIIEYAMAVLLMDWGIKPKALIGHSIGEYAAACIAGIFSLADALKLVAARGRLMQALPGGSMLAVPLPENEAAKHLGAGIALAAVNAPGLCVVSGEDAAIEMLAAELKQAGLECRKLHTSHAFHSSMMEPILEAFGDMVKSVKRQAPGIPVMSNLTGTWLTAEEAVDPVYWVKHLRGTVRFSAGIQKILSEPGRILVEVGAGNTLSTLARQHLDTPAKAAVIHTIRHINEKKSGEEVLVQALGKLWLAGVKISWKNYYSGEKRFRVPLPPYPFEKSRHWIEPAKNAYQPGNNPAARVICLLIADKDESASGWEQELAGENCDVVRIKPGAKNSRLDAKHYEIAPEGIGYLKQIVRELALQPGAAGQEDAKQSVSDNTGAAVDSGKALTVEERIAQAFKETLGLSSIGLNDDFFELGGHSLIVTRLVSRLRDDFKVEIPLRSFYEQPTVAGMLAVIGKDRAPADSAMNIDALYANIARIADSGSYPVSSSQKRLFYVSIADQDTLGYNIPLALTIEGSLDRAKLEAAFKKLILRHESLRTSFHAAGGEPLQKVHRDAAFTINYSETGPIPAKADLDRMINAFIAPFNLAAAPLFRIKLVKLGQDKHLLVFDMHHIISDAVSMAILVKELVMLYENRELPALPLQYRDFAVWQNNLLNSGFIRQQEQYWLEKLEGFTYTELPRKSIVAGETMKVISRETLLDAALTKQVDDFCRENKLTKNMFMLAVFKLLLRMEIDQDDITIGIPIAGRRSTLLENLIGIFINVLVIRSRAAQGSTFMEYLDCIRQTVMESQENQEYPYEMLYAKMKETAGFTGNSLFSILFNYLPVQDNSEIALAGLSFKPYKMEVLDTRFDIILYVNERQDGLLLEILYKSSLYEDYIITRIMEGFGTVTRAVLDNRQATLKDIEQKAGGSHDEAVQDFGIEFDNDELIV